MISRRDPRWAHFFQTILKPFSQRRNWGEKIKKKVSKSFEVHHIMFVRKFGRSSADPNFRSIPTFGANSMWMIELFSNFSLLWLSPTTTTPQTATAWKSYGSYCISIHWKEGIAPGNGARTVRPAAAVAAAAGPSLTPRIWRKFVWDDQTDAPRVVVVVRGNAIDMSKEASESWRSWSFDLLLLHKQQYTKFNSYSTSLMLIQSCGRSL